MPGLDSGQSRIAYIDWMRGLACLLMFQTHCYDSWLSPAARQSRFFMYSQLGGTFPAPLFLFLAGISCALVTEKLCEKKFSPAQIARRTIRRGAEILLFGLLFRLQEFVVAMGWSPWTDLLRVDILNTIGVSMILIGMLTGGVCWLMGPAAGAESGSRTRLALVVASSVTAALISALTPPLWTTWRPRWLPWPLESYIDGVHNLGVPQSWQFPIFPWSAFAFAGLAAGFVLLSAWVRGREARIFVALGVAGVAIVEAARWVNARPWQIYAVYDFWHTSPSFFLIRLGMLLVILAASYAWCRWGAGQWGFSPVIQLGQASLLVYWVHMEFVYGRLSILHKRRVGIPAASVGLVVVTAGMVALAVWRTRRKARGADVAALPGRQSSSQALA